MTDSGTFGDSVYEHGDGIEDAENLDPVENLTSDDPDEIMQTGYVPPDREPYDLRHAPTPAEEREGPDISERLAAEEPDSTRAIDDLPDPRAGRLVAPDEGAHPDREADQVAADVGPAGYASSAEEAATRIVDEDALDERPPS